MSMNNRMEPRRLEEIELLTEGEDGRAVPGRRIPRYDSWVAAGYDDSPPPPDRTLAYRHKFYRIGLDGQPDYDTLVTFLVPHDLCRLVEYSEGWSSYVPSDRALRLVEQRMGWVT